MTFRSAVAALAILVLGACSHTYYQFHIGGDEESAIYAAQQGLTAGAQGDLGTLSVAVDLNGRRAIETLLAAMTLEQTENDAQFQRLSRALFLGVMSNGEDPIAAVNMDTMTIASRFAHRIAQASGLDPMGLVSGVAAMVGIPVAGDDDGQRLNEMHGSLRAGQIGTCTELHPVISYNAGILGHVRTQLAENDPVYVDWRQRVRAIHLVRFRCATGHALMLFTHDRGQPSARAIGWHFLNEAQWVALEPQLRYALDLPQ
jgi:hypothetical protein